MLNLALGVIQPIPGVDGGESSKLNKPSELRVAGVEASESTTLLLGVRSGRGGLGPFGCCGSWTLGCFWSMTSFILRWLVLFSAAALCLRSRYHRRSIGIIMARSAIGMTMAAISP